LVGPAGKKRKQFVSLEGGGKRRKKKVPDSIEAVRTARRKEKRASLNGRGKRAAASTFAEGEEGRVKPNPNL